MVVVAVSWPIAIWDQQVLTESLALSTLALVAAATVWAAQGLDRARVIALVAAVALWLAVRDSHVVPVAVAAVGLGAWAVARRPRRRRLAVLAAAGLGVLAFLAAVGADAGHRGRLPLEHTYAVRVLPYPDRVEWFAEHGMPDGPALAAIPEVTAPGKAPFTGLAPLPAWERWRAWLARDGRSTLLRYVVAHPGYVVSEPRRQPERVFNNGEGLATYRPLALREVPGSRWLGYPAIPLTVVVAAIMIPIADRRGTLTSAPFLAGGVLVLTALPHALVIWHSDGMESARHLLIPSTQTRVGTLLLAAGALLATPRTDPRRGHGARFRAKRVRGIGRGQSLRRPLARGRARRSRPDERERRDVRSTNQLAAEGWVPFGSETRAKRARGVVGGAELAEPPTTSNDPAKPVVRAGLGERSECAKFGGEGSVPFATEGYKYCPVATRSMERPPAGSSASWWVTRVRM